MSPCAVEVLVACPKPCEPRAGIVAEAPAQAWRCILTACLSRVSTSTAFPPTLALVREYYPGFCPLCAMEKLYNDAQTPPNVKGTPAERHRCVHPAAAQDPAL